MIRRISKHPHEGKNYLPKNKIWLANFNYKCYSITMFYFKSSFGISFRPSFDSSYWFCCENMLHAIIKFQCLYYPEKYLSFVRDK